MYMVYFKLFFLKLEGLHPLYFLKKILLFIICWATKKSKIFLSACTGGAHLVKLQVIKLGGIL